LKLNRIKLKGLKENLKENFKRISVKEIKKNLKRRKDEVSSVDVDRLISGQTSGTCITLT